MEYYVDKFNRRRKSQSEVKMAQVGQVSSGGAASGVGMTLEPSGWDAKRRKIINTEIGTVPGDVATIDQTLISSPSGGFQHGTENYNILKSGSDLIMNNKKIKNLADGKDSSDAVTVNQIMGTNGRWWDARSLQVSRVKDGSSKQDVVTVNQFTSALRTLRVSTSTPKVYNYVFNADNKNISNVKEGILPTDAAIVKQIPTDYMKLAANMWDAKSQPISNLKEGVLPTDAAVVKQIPTDYMKSTGNKWNAKLQPISNVKQGVDANDVTTLKQTLTLGGPPHWFECGKYIYDLTSLKK